MSQQTPAGSIPKTHLLPQPEWQSDTMIEVRGDLFELFDQALQQSFQGLQKAGQVYQQIIAQNIKTEKIKLGYVWNNGQPATDEEVKEYEAYMQKIREQQLKQLQENEDKGTINGADARAEAAAEESAAIAATDTVETKENEELPAE